MKYQYKFELKHERSKNISLWLPQMFLLFLFNSYPPQIGGASDQTDIVLSISKNLFCLYEYLSRVASLCQPQICLKLWMKMLPKAPYKENFGYFEYSYHANVIVFTDMRE